MDCSILQAYLQTGVLCTVVLALANSKLPETQWQLLSLSIAESSLAGQNISKQAWCLVTRNRMAFSLPQKGKSVCVALQFESDGNLLLLPPQP